jgi:hypothetical protein
MPTETTRRATNEGATNGGATSDGPGGEVEATGGVDKPADYGPTVGVGSGVEVKAVEEVVGRGTSGRPTARRRPSATARRTDVHRLVLEARVTALEAQLERKERQLDVLRRQYEDALAEGGAAGGEPDEPRFSWLFGD